MAEFSKLTWQKMLRNADDLTHAEFRVLMIVSTWTNENGANAHPGFAKIVAASCVSEPTAKKALKTLIAKGWLIFEQAGGNQYGKGAANVYRLACPEGASSRFRQVGGKQKSSLDVASARDVKGVNGFHEGGKPFSARGEVTYPHQIFHQIKYQILVPVGYHRTRRTTMSSRHSEAVTIFRMR
ncbi:helix-turn-helix domain-containing protein [Rhodococcus qingshengii]|uniref:helix-turn-helix domain-containing protein n=1 Tax=Rhodococcus qingshengii TaxID=334542 RepID=UPI001C8BEA51|nr:helix-turn-helix domain-containing protein [Rhodococcus qingshengii]MBX9147977.1 helix-turn-helix domain-containing protein [Rhodococcus qingshengii]